MTQSGQLASLHRFFSIPIKSFEAVYAWFHLDSIKLEERKFRDSSIAHVNKFSYKRDQVSFYFLRLKQWSEVPVQTANSEIKVQTEIHPEPLTIPLFSVG